MLLVRNREFPSLWGEGGGGGALRAILRGCICVNAIHARTPCGIPERRPCLNILGSNSTCMLRQDPPPWFEFLAIFDLFAPWYRRSGEAPSVKISFKEFKGKVGQMCHLSCLLAWGFYTELYTKSAVSESSIALGRLNLTFLPLGLSPLNLAHLFSMLLATKFASDFLIFA